MANDVERRFHEAMLNIYWRAGRETGYWPNYYLRKVRHDGGVGAARYYLRAKGLFDGLKRLAELGRLDISVEQLVLDPAYSSLFSYAEKALASAKLAQARLSV